MTVRVRHQLTLFLPELPVALVEPVRRVVDPVQASLIPAHVTLVREDEIPETCWQELCRNLQSPDYSLILTFGQPERSVDHGILMPCKDGQTEFQRLRTRMFEHLADRLLCAHLTLAHPRNPQAPGNTLENTGALKNGITVRFEEVALIRQVGSDPWEVLQKVPLCRVDPAKTSAGGSGLACEMPGKEGFLP